MCSLVRLKRSIGCRDMAILSLGVLRRSRTKITRGLLVGYMLGWGVQTLCKLCVNVEKYYCVNFVYNLFLDWCKLWSNFV